ncbi:MAG TPA: DUF3750 domain-containing protein [bacterium]|nr:DUF3750 domain-containing protein [bacterium]
MPKNNYQNIVKKNKYQVFLAVSQGHAPFGFAVHPWFVCNKKGQISRWEILLQKNPIENWGHLHKDNLSPFQGINTIPFFNKLKRTGRVLGVIEGDEHSITEKMIDVIENSKNTYPYLDCYNLLGPNSNTYVQWVLNQFPEFPAKLPENAFGKNYLQTTGDSNKA